MTIKFRFTIGQKLAVGFGVLLVAVLSTSALTYYTLQENLQDNQKINEIYRPSATVLNDLYSLIAESKMLIKNWAYIEKKPETTDKKKLVSTHSEKYPELNDQIQKLVEAWDEDEQDAYRSISFSVDTLFEYHKHIMSTLNSFASYNNTAILFVLRDDVDNKGKISALTDRILKQMGNLRQIQEDKMNEANQDMENSFANFQRLVIILGFILVISVIGIAIWATNTLVGPIDSIKRTIEEMGRGILPKKKLRVRADEIGDMSVALNSLVSGLKETSRFALEIGDGNFSSEYTPLGDNDVLGNALLVMRDNLKRAGEVEERQKEENAQRSWAAQGLAKFGDILRENSEDIEELSSVIISNLVKYLNANQGGLFILNDEDKDNVFIELIAFYAYSRKKYMQKEIMIGENLVGQCVQEGETIYLTDLPEGYIEITSGLGHETPRSLMIVPLKLDEEIYGVVEIASFNEFKPFEIDFVEKIGETIASTIQRVKITIQTNLLLEESKSKSEMLAQQEAQAKEQKDGDNVVRVVSEDNEEFQDRIDKYEMKILEMYEEIESQRVEMLGKEMHLVHNDIALNNTLGRISMSLKGVIDTVNDFILAKIGMSEDMMTGKFLSDFLSDETIAAIEFQEIWSSLTQGHIQTRTDRYSFDNQKYWFKVTFTPLRDENDEYYKVLAFFEDVSDYVEETEDLSRKLEKAEITVSKLKGN